MERSTNSTELKAALTAFETSISTPIVSGELNNWVAELHQSWQAVSKETEQAVKRGHPQQYKEIADVDMELLPLTEQLRVDNQEIEEQRAHVDSLVANLVERVPRSEADEGQA